MEEQSVSQWEKRETKRKEERKYLPSSDKMRLAECDFPLGCSLSSCTAERELSVWERMCKRICERERIEREKERGGRREEEGRERKREGTSGRVDHF